jgi:hypothetical protein
MYLDPLFLNEVMRGWNFSTIQCRISRRYAEAGLSWGIRGVAKGPGGDYSRINKWGTVHWPNPTIVKPRNEGDIAKQGW